MCCFFSRVATICSTSMPASLAALTLATESVHVSKALLTLRMTMCAKIPWCARCFTMNISHPPNAIASPRASSLRTQCCTIVSRCHLAHIIEIELIPSLKETASSLSCRSDACLSANLHQAFMTDAFVMH